MSLSAAMATGVSGLLNQAEGINVIGNNISNVNTIGFKGSRMLFADMLSSSTVNNSQIGRGVQIQKVDNIFGSGPITNSTNVTDLAIQGEGFFVLGAPTTAAGNVVANEAAYYTKAGAFRLDSTGFGLINPDGYKLLDTDGHPIIFPATNGVNGAGGAQLFQKVTGIDSTGAIALLYADPATGISSTLYYAGSTNAGVTNTAIAAPIAATPRIAEAKIPNPQGMAKQGGTLFTATAITSGLPAGAGNPVTTKANGTTERLLSNYLEQSNVDMATEFVSMITTQRAYSANSKTITTADEMTQEALNLKR